VGDTDRDLSALLTRNASRKKRAGKNPKKKSPANRGGADGVPPGFHFNSFCSDLFRFLFMTVVTARINTTTIVITIIIE
jgi:hypothetical protein